MNMSFFLVVQILRTGDTYLYEELSDQSSAELALRITVGSQSTYRFLRCCRFTDLLKCVRIEYLCPRDDLDKKDQWLPESQARLHGNFKLSWSCMGGCSRSELQLESGLSLDSAHAALHSQNQKIFFRRASVRC
jgi:hypothetical protein